MSLNQYAEQHDSYTCQTTLQVQATPILTNVSDNDPLVKILSDLINLAQKKPIVSSSADGSNRCIDK